MKPTHLAAILLLASSAWAQRGSITGRVTDAQSGDPLVAANVVAVSPVLAAPTGSATDARGRYTVANLPAGEYTLTASYIGYQKQEQTVRLEVGATLEANFALNPQAIQFDTYVVTASRRRERIEDAPAAITVITKQTIRRQSNTNLGDYLKAVKGVDFTQSGVDSYNLSARGFNASFSSRLLTLTDGRMANIPSLRLIAYNVIPISFEDVEQFEIVLGPSSALYGPNAHSGVLNIITRSPRESAGTTFNVQAGSHQIRKLTMRHATAWGPVSFKISGVAFTAEDWHHINDNEYEGHDPAFLGRPYQVRDRVNNDGGFVELGNPTFTADLLSQLVIDEIPGNGIDDNGNGFIDEHLGWEGWAFADGVDNNTIAIDGEPGSPIVTQEMIDAAAADPFNRYFVPGTDIVLWGLDADDLGKAYADGVDNNHNGGIDEGIDTGIDDNLEAWYDGIDNDGDGEIDEDDERSDAWLDRFRDYRYDEQGNLVVDSNDDGIYGGDGDLKVNFGHLRRWLRDANNDGIDDFPVFDVQNYRYDVRADYDPNPDLHASFSHGYAWARNINITGIARFLADGWIYRYYQGRLRYKNLFMQAYLNTSFSGPPSHPTRNLATGGVVFDRSRKFSGQFQHSMEFLGQRLRFVWGSDYFLTLPDTRGTILSDDQLFDNQDNNGNGEAGSPFTFNDANENLRYDPGEFFISWSAAEGPDTVHGAIADGLDNDGDGLVDEGIDETEEDNRFVVNELGLYYQLNWALSEKVDFIQATRFDVHDRLTDLVAFNNDSYNYSPLNWRLNPDQADGTQISPKFGLVFKPADRQNFRLTWARAYNTPSNQALFLDLFVTRASVFRVYARGAAGGYSFPRCENGNIHYLDVGNFHYTCMDTSQHLAFYLSADPRVEGYFKSRVPNLPEIGPEIVTTLEVGYKGQLGRTLYGTLDIFRSHYNSFVSAITFITPVIVNKTLLTTDYNGDGIVNSDPEHIVDQDDLEEARRNWTNDAYLVGIAALDTTPGLTTPIVVGYANYGETDMWGLDMSLSWFINRSVTLDLNYSFLSISDFRNPITGANDPINAPRHKAGLKLQYNPPSEMASVSLGYRYVDSFFWASGIYFGQIKAYGILDLHGSYQFSPHLAAMMSITNLLDNRHVEIIGGPALGRTAMLRLQASI